jgi:DNA-binding NarL/FixJ family response regulator
MLSMYPEEQYAVRALRSGASGYLTKESAPDELISAIRKVCGGGRYVSASLAENIALTFDRKADQSPHESLSDREYQIMCMIASGKAVKDIGRELSLSVKTISTYRTRILIQNEHEDQCRDDATRSRTISCPSLFRPHHPPIQIRHCAL